jgi:DHA2 family multidrug resistance protein
MEHVNVVEYGWRRNLIVIAVMLASPLETLDSTTVNVALPTIEGNIGAALDQGIWIVTGYIISNVVSIPLNPFLTRLLGRKTYFAACIIGFTTASFLCSSAHSLGALVAFRVLQGAFGGGLIATAQVVMRETFPQENIGISSALFAMALILGPAFGPLAGGYITDNVSWQWIFDVNIVPGILASVTIIWLLRDPAKPEKLRIDWGGVALLAIGLGACDSYLTTANAAIGSPIRESLMPASRRLSLWSRSSGGSGAERARLWWICTSCVIGASRSAR